MDEDRRPAASAEGVRSFMAGVANFLRLHTLEKSAEYDLDFLAERPYKNPRRYHWEEASAEERPSDSTQSTQRDVRFDTEEEEPEEEGSVAQPESGPPVHRHYRK